LQQAGGRYQFDKIDYIDADKIGFQFSLTTVKKTAKIITIHGDSEQTVLELHLNELKDHAPYNKPDGLNSLIEDINCIIPKEFEFSFNQTKSIEIPISVLEPEAVLEGVQKRIHSIIIALTGDKTGHYDRGDESDLFAVLHSGVSLNEHTAADDALPTGDVVYFDDEGFEKPGFDDFTREKIVTLENGNKQWVFQMDRVNRNITLGRTDAKRRVFPNVDLTEVFGAKKGVSRIHAAITYDPNDRICYIEDLGSSNGTFVNGFRIAPKEIRMIRSNDRIRLGGLLMTIYLE